MVSFGPSKAAYLIFLAGLLVLFFLVRAWQAQSGAGRLCVLQINTSGNGSYLEIELDKQDPTEPVFTGQLMMYVDPLPTKSVTIDTTGAQGYGPSTYPAEAKPDLFGKHYDIGPVKSVGFEPDSGSHRLFPFDSASFKVTITTKPEISVDNFRLINRVEGFVLDCGDVSATSSSGTQNLQFKFSRNPIVQLTAIIVAIASIGFAVLIFRSKTIESISASAGSSFFSLWTVRSILGSQIHTFPTVLDMIVLSSSIVLLLAVLWKVVEGHEATPWYFD
jgi:hypothetical protein